MSRSGEAAIRAGQPGAVPVALDQSGMPAIGEPAGPEAGHAHAAGAPDARVDDAVPAPGADLGPEGLGGAIAGKVGTVGPQALRHRDEVAEGRPEPLVGEAFDCIAFFPFPVVCDALEDVRARIPGRHQPPAGCLGEGRDQAQPPIWPSR